jgi:type III secretion system FlhB-like substrate exporter
MEEGASWREMIKTGKGGKSVADTSLLKAVQAKLSVMGRNLLLEVVVSMALVLSIPENLFDGQD